MMNSVWWGVSLASVLFLQACAFDVTKVDYSPVFIDEATPCDEVFVLSRKTEVDLGTGYSRVLKAQSRWECVGRVEHGGVFRSKDQLLTIEAANIYEAYLVVSAGKLMGFYLPAKDAYSPLGEPVVLASH